MKLAHSLLTAAGLACAVMAMPVSACADEVVTVYQSPQEKPALQSQLSALSSSRPNDEDVVTLYVADAVPVQDKSADVKNELYEQLQPATPSESVDKNGDEVVTLFESGKLYAESYHPSEANAIGSQYQPVLTASGQATMYAQAGATKPLAEESHEQTSEEVIANTNYSLGLMSGYGFKLGDRPRLDVTEMLPFIAFPISGVVGRSFYRGVFEYKIEPVLGLLTSFNNRGEAGLSPIGVRYNFTGLSGRTVPYVEGQLGAVYLDVPNSVQGSTFNFITGAAAGIKYFITQKTALNLQCRYRHLSNAGIDTPNPGINSVQLLVGISHY